MTCADPGIFVSGGPGQSDKKDLTTFFFFVFVFFLFSPQLILQQSNGQFQRNLSFFKVPEGVHYFPRGGGPTFSRRGVQLLIPYRNPYNLEFSRASGPPVPPLDPHLYDQKIQHSHSTEQHRATHDTTNDNSDIKFRTHQKLSN